MWIVLLKDLGDYALYLNKTNNCFAGFEVHKIRIRKAETYTIQGRTFSLPNRRVIAGNDEFGRYAWHYPNIEMVYEKYPQFKKYSQEIETNIKSGLESVLNPFLCVMKRKTRTTGSNNPNGTIKVRL